MEVERGLTRSIIDKLHSWDIQGDHMEEKSMVIPKVSSMNFILWLSKEIKWKVKVV